MSMTLVKVRGVVHRWRLASLVFGLAAAGIGLVAATEVHSRGYGWLTILSVAALTAAVCVAATTTLSFLSSSGARRSLARWAVLWAASGLLLRVPTVVSGNQRRALLGWVDVARPVMFVMAAVAGCAAVFHFVSDRVQLARMLRAPDADGLRSSQQLLTELMRQAASGSIGLAVADEIAARQIEADRLSGRPLLDLLVGREAATVVVVGRAGSGKSVLLGQMIEAARKMEPHRRLVLINPKKECSDYGGVRVETSFAILQSPDLRADDMLFIDGIDGIDINTRVVASTLAVLPNRLVVTSQKLSGSEWRTEGSPNATSLHRVLTSGRDDVHGIRQQAAVMDITTVPELDPKRHEVFYAAPGTTSCRWMPADVAASVLVRALTEG